MPDLLTIEQASQACGVSRDTIKRRLRRHEFPHAIRGVARGQRVPPWLIPVGDLLDAGFVPSAALAAAGALEGDGLDEISHLRDRAARLEGLLLARDAHLQDLRAEVRRLHVALRAAVSALRSSVDECLATDESDD